MGAVHRMDDSNKNCKQNFSLNIRRENTTWETQCQKLTSFHSIGMCRMQQFLAVLRTFFDSSLLYTLSFHPFPLTSLPPSFTSSCHLFLGPLLSLIVSKFIYNTFLGILLSSILCTCPNHCNLFNLIVFVCFLTSA